MLKKIADVKTETAKLPTINKRVCPASIFANKRIDRLKGRIKQDVTSIKTKKASKKEGTPAGIKNLKKVKQLQYKPKKVTPKNKMKAKLKVTHI